MKFRKSGFFLVLLILSASMTQFAKPVVEMEIVSPEPDEVWVGKKKIEVKVSGIESKDIHSVEFYLNGRFLREMQNPPFFFSL